VLVNLCTKEGVESLHNTHSSVYFCKCARSQRLKFKAVNGQAMKISVVNGQNAEKIWSKF